MEKPVLENAKNYIYCRCVELHCAPPRWAPGFLFCCSPCQPGQKVDHADSLPESSEWFIEDQAFSPSYDLAPFLPPSPDNKLSLFLSIPACRRSSVFSTGEGMRSQIIRRRESLVLCKSFSTLCPRPTLINLTIPLQRKCLILLQNILQSEQFYEVLF
jgi:hypothetical protein